MPNRVHLYGQTANSSRCILLLAWKSIKLARCVFSCGSVLHRRKSHSFDKKVHNQHSSHPFFIICIFQNGKLQSRRLAVSPDNRCLLITTNRVKSLKSFLKAATGNNSDPSSTKVIDISRIDRIVEGQLSNRFLMQHTF